MSREKERSHKTSEPYWEIPCALLARVGKCTNRSCGYKHDEKFIAICQNYLNGKCEDRRCMLSHTPLPHRMPDCVHNLAGVCNLGSSCVYRHASWLNNNAEICREFLKGFCNFGLHCRNIHKFHCPTWRKNKTCIRGDACWHYHEDPTQLSLTRVPTLVRPTPSTQIQASFQSSNSRIVKIDGALYTKNFNPMKFIRPPPVTSNPSKKRKVVESIAEALNTSVSRASSDVSLEKAVDDETIEKTGFLPLIKDKQKNPATLKAPQGHVQTSKSASKSNADKSQQSGARKTTRICRVNQGKYFVDFEEDKFYGFLAKDGTIAFEKSLKSADILPKEFLLSK